MGILIHSNLISADRLTSNLKTGTLSLPLTAARELSSGAIINASGNGGLLASDTTPVLSITSGGHRLSWAAANVDAICWQVVAPVDFDEASTMVVHVRASMAATNDTPTLGISFVEAQSGSSVGGNTAAVTGATPATYTRTIAASALAGGNQWTITLTPAAHGTDILRIDAVWITYTRKS